MELKNECLLRVGWAALEGRRALGTDERSFGYGGTGMKSNCGKFEHLDFEASNIFVYPVIISSFFFSSSLKKRLRKMV